jgi:hypothetical protein
MTTFDSFADYLSNHLNWEVIVFSLIIIVLTVVLFRSFSGGKKSGLRFESISSYNK